jgi:hypothetical protein
MSHCCKRGDPTSPSSTQATPPTAIHRGWPGILASAVQWAIPTVTLILIPKCPLCLAAHVALWTGLGLSFSAARSLRLALIALSILALGILAASRTRRVLVRPSHH